MDPDAQVRYVEGVLGPHEVGVMVAIYLFGLVTMQTYTYFQTYPEDPRGTKLFVAFIWVLLLSHTIISSFSLYQRTVVEFGVIANVEQYPAVMCGAFSISGLIGALVQAFFANRLRIFSGQWRVPVVCWALSLARFGSLLCLSVTACQAPSVTEYIQRWKWLVVLAMSVSAIVDVTIAGSLTYSLWSQRTSFFKHTQKVMDKIIMYTLQTGLLTGFSSILMLILFLSVDNFAWVAAYLIISGVFANYLLVSLNARTSFRDGMLEKPVFFDIEGLHVPPLPMKESGPNRNSYIQSTRETVMQPLPAIEPGVLGLCDSESTPTLRESIDGARRTSTYTAKTYVNSPAIV